MSIDADRNRLSEMKMLKKLQYGSKITDMITVYLSDGADSYSSAIHCALIPSTQIEEMVCRPEWDIDYSDLVPRPMAYSEGNNERVEYLRYGNDDGIEPLIIERQFDGMREDYKEICEEFRLFHELYHDQKQNQYIKFDDSGNEYIVAVVEHKCIKIRLKEIQQFLAIKEMHLTIQFDFLAFSEYSREELDIQAGNDDRQEYLLCWRYRYGDSEGTRNYRTLSNLTGKHLIPPLTKSKSGMWGFAEKQKKRYVEFIIDIDDCGDEILHTSNPDELAGKTGATPDAPHFLTPIHFRKQVLDKYYHQPSKYSVEDSILRCGGLWTMYLDNHHDEKACAWLGDLGSKLPYEEQLHWRTHNIPPEGSISETFYNRQIMAEFADSDRIEHLFLQRYDDLREACDEYLGWQLLLPLSSEDEHHLQSLRVPATDEQRDFDELVLSLTKILIDSLNEKELNKLIPTQQKSEIKGGISRLDAAFNICGLDNGCHHISFLRKLQNLRSSSVAHRKGEKYRKIAKEFNVDSESLRSIFSGVLAQALEVLDYFIIAVREEQFRSI